MFPSETTCENPIPSAPAQSITAVTSAPDWLTKATCPSTGMAPAKLALNLSRGTRSPRQLGPSTLRPSKAAASSASRRSSSAPSAPASRKPAEMTSTACTPASPQLRTTSGTLAAGVHTTARSGGDGVSPTLA